MGKVKVSTKDIVLIALLGLIDGRGAAKVVYSIVRQWMREQGGGYQFHNFDMAAFRNALHRLKKDGLIQNTGWGIWGITKKGKSHSSYFERMKAYERFIGENKNKQPDAIVIFDIPEMQKKKREYLRLELIALGFNMLQKSVWIGKGPLPMEFIEYIKEMQLWRFLHIFTIKAYGTIGQ